jgi:hypothetical protein
MMQEQWHHPAPPSPAFVAELARLTVWAMAEAEQCEAQRSVEYARRHFGLDSLASDWSEMLLELEADLALNPVPGFKAAE